MTTKELLAKLNILRARAGKTELAAWKSSREKLETAIADLVEELGDVDETEVEQTEETKPTDDFQMSQEELDQQTERPKADDETDQTEQPSDLSDVEGQTEQPAEPVIPRGAIGAMSIELLTASDEPYESIVGKIKALYPTAKTTARSLASVAMDLRRDGVEVPSRRKPAKAKETAPQQAAEAPAGE